MTRQQGLRHNERKQSAHSEYRIVWMEESAVMSVSSCAEGAPAIANAGCGGDGQRTEDGGEKQKDRENTLIGISIIIDCSWSDSFVK